MSQKGLVNIIVAYENFLGVFRNYSILKKKARFFIKIRIFVETCFIIYAYLCFINNYVSIISADVHHRFLLSTFVSFCFTTTAAINNASSVFLSIATSRRFVELVASVEAVHKLFAADAKYQRAIKKHRYAFYIHISLFAAAMVILVVGLLHEISFKTPTATMHLFYFAYLGQLLRFFAEYFIFYEIVEYVMVPMRHFEWDVSIAARKMCEVVSEDDVDWAEVRRDLENWEAVHRHLAAATDCVSDCFKLQITFSVMTTTLYVIALLHRAIAYMMGVVIEMDRNRFMNTAILLVASTAAACLVARAGQRAQNAACSLACSLASLHNTMVYSPRPEAAACARRCGALARRLRAAPLRLRLLGALVLQAAILANMLATIVDYTVMLLQFGHVV